MKKYCIFDLDGTLVDSMGEWSAAMTSILDEEKIAHPEDFINKITPLGVHKLAEYFMALGVSGSYEEIISRMGSYAFDAYENRILIKKGVDIFLKKLRESGHILGVLTASPHITADPCLKRNGIYDLFEIVLSTEDFGITKNDPEIYKKAAARFGADISEISFFDDNIRALGAAKLAGCEIYGVFDESSAQNTREIREMCKGYIESFEGLDPKNL